MTPGDGLLWRKSSFSNDNVECVEIAQADRVAIRDSKHPDPHLTIGQGAWRRLLSQFRHSPY
ncbi:hypothetical protein [Alloactinosynnema sp. L-07]|uniref:DUF397 domain-containing protein n=1 Tax=Alloactinosynnema sp. L-07 TaxID=1653480 RepID=UPI00065F07FF|nr:DUF397 domain-containing protein [Alloactinosynnema sp. L-07]CRK59619.1 hypothetical protein [Alloactinosynnema sp. L-07]